MDIRALCAAAVVAVGVGSAAEAATYAGMFTLVSAVEEWEGRFGEPVEEDRLLPGYWGVSTGSTVAATINITPDVGGVMFELFTTAGEIFNSFLASGDSGYFGFEREGSGWANLTWNGAEAGFIVYNGDDYPWFPVVNGTFTVDIAPVPLPVGAALLPLGIGALAMMRKRRRLA